MGIEPGSSNNAWAPEPVVNTPPFEPSTFVSSWKKRTSRSRMTLRLSQGSADRPKGDAQTFCRPKSSRRTHPSSSLTLPLSFPPPSLMSSLALHICLDQADARVIWDYMADEGTGGAIDETTGRLRERFSTPEEEEALALETLGTARVAGLGPQVPLTFPAPVLLFLYVATSVLASRLGFSDLDTAYSRRGDEFGAREC